jgi:hypothetical protein
MSSLAWHTAITMAARDDIHDDDDGFGRDDLDRLARRAIDSVLHLVRRANALAGGVLMFAVLACVSGFLLGLAALSDGMRTVWVALGGFFAVVGVGSVVIAMWRLRSVRRSADSLVAEVRALIGGDRTTERTVIDTVLVTEERSDDGIADLSREFFGFRSAIGDRAQQFRALTSALSAVTTFPGLMAIAALVSFVFLGLGVIFAISLAL